jgi:hypothetical protein
MYLPAAILTFRSLPKPSDAGKTGAWPFLLKCYSREQKGDLTTTCARTDAGHKAPMYRCRCAVKQLAIIDVILFLLNLDDYRLWDIWPDLATRPERVF